MTTKPTVRIPGEDPVIDPVGDAAEPDDVEPVERGRKPTKATKPAATTPAGLPRPQDIDTSKLDRAVLTTEGWLVSTKPPARSVLR